MQIKKPHSNESGSALVLVLLLMVVLLGFSALVTDAGRIYINKAKMASAMDSAVLAGVQELPDHPDQAIAAATNYAVLNGVPAQEVSIEVDDQNRTISATANRQLGLFFARALGIQTADLSAHAKARIASVSAAKGVVPFGILEGDLLFGQEMILKEGGGDGDTGWYNALSLGGNGASTYLENIKYGYSEEINAGLIVPTESGNMSGPTSEGVNYRNSLCHHVPRCTIDHFAEGCARILIIPVIRIADMNDRGNVSFVEVVGFAAFLVDQYVGHGNDNEVRGTFIKYVIPGKTSDNIGDFGLYACKLTE